jgi:hypothetical protein
MIGKHTTILFLVAVICIGIGLSWQHYRQTRPEKSDSSPILYHLDLRSGVLHANRRDDVPLVTRALRVVGMLALLLALPLLISDITHRRQRR